jgi:asparagine synthase (glutamine-hydrolysing)
MSGISGICEPGLDLSPASIAPMLGALESAGCTTDISEATGAILGAAWRWPTQGLGRLQGLHLALDAELHNAVSLPGILLQLSPAVSNTPQILLELYRKEGLGFIDRIEGSFAIALWDDEHQRLVLAIDRMGIKALYWRRERDKLLFATRLNAIRAAQRDSVRIHKSALMQFFVFGATPAPLAIDEGTQKLRPGHLLVFERGHVRQSCYWDLQYVEERGSTAASWAEEVRSHLRAAVDAHLDDCVSTRTGSFLSGGTDSSTVVAFASNHVSPLPTFTIYFREPSYSEIEFARTVSSRFQTEAFEECLIPDTAYECISSIVRAYDEPFGDSSVLATYRCLTLARDHGVEVMLAGDGGDELFAGNHHYLQDKYFDLYAKLPVWLRSAILERLVRLLPWEGPLGLPRRYVRRAKIANPQRFLSYRFFLSTTPERVFTSEFLADAPVETWLAIAEGHFRSANASNDLNRLLHLDMKMILADSDLRKVVVSADAAGVRVRFPLLDHRLVEFAGRIPVPLKLRGFHLRYIFKEAMKGILPASVLFKKKQGFGVPIGWWLRSDVNFKSLLADLLYSKSAALHDYFRPGFCKQLVEQLTRARDPTFLGVVLWRLMMFELWHAKNNIGAGKQSVEH